MTTGTFSAKSFKNTTSGVSQPWERVPLECSATRVGRLARHPQEPGDEKATPPGAAGQKS